MVGGLDRYYQIATCWRDEDLRADRQFEFRQLDLEMSFVDREDVLDVMERAVVAAFEAVGREPPARPFPRMRYAEAMAQYGTDKPDLRFGARDPGRDRDRRAASQFGVFASAPAVRYLVAPRAFSRAELARLEEIAKEWGAKGLAYLVNDESGEIALADREVPLRRRAGRVRRRARHDGALRRRRRGDGGARPRRPARRTSAASSSWPRPGARGLPLDDRLPALRARRGDRQLDVPPPSVHRADAGRRGQGRVRPGRCARASTTT